MGFGGLFDFLSPARRAENRLLDQMVNLKLTVKSLHRSAQKCAKIDPDLKTKCQNAIKAVTLPGENIRDGRDTEETRTTEPAPTGEPAGWGRVETGDASG